jgi:nicotinamidase-related amidase
MLDKDSVVLLIVDFQEKLLPKIPVAEAIMEQTVQLIRFAREMDIPLVWTEQYPKGLGPTSPKIADELGGFKPREKMAFGCFGDDGIVEAVNATGRQQVLIAGIEAHVCVMQTALQAQERGFSAFVVRDAVASRHKADYKAGLARMERSGVELLSSEMAMFEIMKVAGTTEFKRVLPFLK